MPTLTVMQVLGKREKMKLPSGAALWRLNQVGFLEVRARAQPRRPISRAFAADMLTKAAEDGLWQPGQSKP
jgi:hypothetical protein